MSEKDPPDSKAEGQNMDVELAASELRVEEQQANSGTSGHGDPTSHNGSIEPSPIKVRTDDIDWLIYHYLVECGYKNTSFALLNESTLTTSEGPGAPLSLSPVTRHAVPDGHLVRLLHRSLLYMQADARYRGDDTTTPNLITTVIPDILPNPSLVKSAYPGVFGPKRISDKPRSNKKGKNVQINDHVQYQIEAPESADPLESREAPEPSEGLEPSEKPEPCEKRESSEKPEMPEKLSPPVVANGKRRLSSDTESKTASSEKKLKTLPNATQRNGKAKAVSPSPVESGNGAKSPDKPAEPATPVVSQPAPKKKSKSRQAPPKRDPAIQDEDLTREDDKDLDYIVKTNKTPSVTILRGHTAPLIRCCKWNPKFPQLLATGCSDATCRIWEVPNPDYSGKLDTARIITDSAVCRHATGMRRSEVFPIDWHPIGSLLATGCADGIARVWTPAGDLTVVLTMHQRKSYSVKWNSRGTHIVTSADDAMICLWDNNTGKMKQKWQSHTDSILDLQWYNEDIFVSASQDTTVQAFTIGRAAPVARFKGHTDEVNRVAFSPCRTMLASVSDDKTARIWSLVSHNAFKVSPSEGDRLIDDSEHKGVLVLEGHTKEVYNVAWAPRNKDDSDGPIMLATASMDKTAKLWDATTGECLHTFIGHTDDVYAVAFHPSGKYMATASNDASLFIWDIKTKKRLLEYRHPDSIYDIAWHPTGSQITVSGEHTDIACVGVEDVCGKALDMSNL